MSITREELSRIEELLKLTDAIGIKDLTDKQWKFIFDKFIKEGVSISSIKLAADPEFTLEQMETIIYALETLKLPREVVSRYCISYIESDIMKTIFDDLKNGVPSSTVEKYTIEFINDEYNKSSLTTARSRLLKNPFDPVSLKSYFIAYSYMDKYNEIAFGNCFMDLNRKIKSRKDINELQDRIADRYNLDNVTIINYILSE